MQLRVHLSVIVSTWIAMQASGVAAATLPDKLDIALNAETRYETNIGFAPDESSEREDFTTRIDAAFGWKVRETATQTFDLHFAPFYAGVMDLSDLSNYGVDAGFTFRQQFGQAFTAPTARLNVVGTWFEFEDSEPRDGYKIDAELALSMRFNARLAAEVGVRYNLREATDDNPEGTLLERAPGPVDGVLDRQSDEVWDNERIGGYARVEFNPLPRLGLFLEYSYMTGDIAATSDIQAFNNPGKFDAVRDFAFEEGIRFLAWRIDVDQHIVSFGGAYRLNEKVSILANLQHQDVDGEDGNDYENTVTTVGISYRL